MLCQLKPEMKRARLEVCQQLLACYESKGNYFLYNIVTEDESWEHHYDLELKTQSLEYYHDTYPRKKKIKTQPSAGKCILTVFWDYRGIIH
jgi:hypothetical protein